MKLVCLGLSHKTAPVDVREVLAVARDDLSTVLQQLVGLDAIAEMLIISTCNRVEFYGVPAAGASSDDVIGAITHYLCNEKQATSARIARHTFNFHGKHALEHLFLVASSLESMVVGEPQILGQVKEAYGGAIEAGTVGPVLRSVMDRALRTAKRIRTETQVAAGAISVSWVAVELARRIFSDLANCTVLVLGAGKMAELAAQNLKENGAPNVIIANRSYERALKLAEAHGWQARAFGDLPFLLERVDIVISSTGSPRFVIGPDTVDGVMRKRKYRSLFMVDIAVPRDIDPRVGDVENVYLYNMDDLEEVTRKNRDERQREVDAAREIVGSEVERYLQWQAGQAITPVITSLRKKVMAIREAELDRSEKVLRDLTEDQRKVVERMTMAMINKFLHEPTVRLKREGNNLDGQRLVEAVRDLFNLTFEEDEAQGAPDDGQRGGAKGADGGQETNEGGKSTGRQAGGRAL